MSSEERKNIFKKYLPKELAVFANKEFEKAIVSSKKDSLVKWAEQTFKGEKRARKDDIINKIKKLEERGMLDENLEKGFLEDLVADELGVYITPDELKNINKIADELEQLSKDKMKIDGKEVDLPTVDYFKKRQEMIDYINSINPSPLLKILSSVISRTFLLASFKSPIVNVVGNSTQGLATSLVRRLGNKKFKGANPDLVKKYVKMNYKIFQESGYDTSRMFEIMDDRKIIGEKITTSQGPGKLRQFGRFMENLVFKNSLGKPDVMFASAHFADSANLISSTMAIKEGLKGAEAKARAREIMLDAISLEPKTNEGKYAREKSIEEAFYGTFTNESAISNITLETRKLLNKATGDLRVGDQIIPFAKTPANVVSTNIEHSGLLFPYNAYQVVKGKMTGDAAMIRTGAKGLVRAGLGILAISLLAELLDSEDYVSEYADYFPKERQLIAIEGATYNSVKIGNKWISLDYFGPFGAPFVGYMNAKKYGNDIPDKVGRYYSGVLRQVMKIPGINEVREAIGNFSQSTKNLVAGDYKKSIDDATDGFADFVSPRVIPAIFYDMAQSLDDYQRRKDTKLSKFINRIPGARENLPEKISLFGEPVKTQPGINPILFGSRIKISEESAIVDELNRLSLSGELPSISLIEYSSERIKVLKEVIGAREFNNLMKDFGTTLYKTWDKLISKEAYQKLPDDKKRQLLDKAKNKILDGVYMKYLNEYKDEVKKHIEKK